MAKLKSPLANRKYEKKWVALTPDNKKVITYAADVKKLADKLEKMKIGKKEAVMTYVLPFDAHFVPANVRY